MPVRYGPGCVDVVLLRGLRGALAGARSRPTRESAERGRVPAIAAMATWRDLGAGVGPLIAGVLLPLAPDSRSSWTGAALALVDAVAGPMVRITPG